MTKQLARFIPFAILGGLILALTAGTIPAQQLPPLPPPDRAVAAQPGDPDAQPGDLPEGAEVLARGPVHEAFASTAETTTPTPVVAKQPPDPIEELPPDQKPEGDNVQWIPGYWHWDDENTQYIWISGFWRATPPGRVWVPGSWREVRGGWQWAPGFWQEPDAQQPTQPELQYLPEPPASIEVGPTVAQPTNTSFYIPGSWVWRGRYLWRPGVWIEYRPNWVWVPAHFRWTPLGYVFVEGYWDYTLANRGVLYAPIAYSQPIYTQPGYLYTPTYVVSEPAMFGALFVRPGWGNYYFGDYFGAPYINSGYRPWAGRIAVAGAFALGYGLGRAWGYDPLWTYYSHAYRNTPNWSSGFNTLYAGRYNGTIAAPPRTLVQQNTVINRITNTNVKNVTNNITVVNRNVTVNKKDVTAVTMVAPRKVVNDLQPEAKVQPITAQVRKQEAQHANQLRNVAQERRKLETAALAQGPVGKQANAQPRTLKLDVPKEAIARSQVKDVKKAPPPNPHVNAKLEPKGKGEPLPKGKGEPKIEPKGKGEPKIEPKGKGEPLPLPKGKGEPKSEPKGKFEPKGKLEPFPEPKGKLEPPPFPRGKGEPIPKGKLEPLPKGKIEPPFPKGKGEPLPLPKGKGEPNPKKKDKEEPKPPPPPPPPSGPAPLARVRPPLVNPSPIAPGRPLGQLQPRPQPARQPMTVPQSPNRQPRVVPKSSPPRPTPPVKKKNDRKGGR